MADDELEDEEEDDQVDIKELRAQAKLAKQLEAKLAELQRDAAFSKALGDAMDTDKRLSYFVKAYDGELDAAAIRAAATDAGFLGQPQERTPAPEEMATQTRIANASAGAGGPQGERLEDAIAKAKNMDELMDVVERAGRPTSRTTQ